MHIDPVQSVYSIVMPSPSALRNEGKLMWKQHDFASQSTLKNAKIIYDLARQCLDNETGFPDEKINSKRLHFKKIR
jgi:hypothetical protein